MKYNFYKFLKSGFFPNLLLYNQSNWQKPIFLIILLFKKKKKIYKKTRKILIKRKV